MNDFIKTVAISLIAVILCLILAKQGKDISVLLTTTVCAAILSVMAGYMRPVIDFFRKLQSIGQLDSEIFAILLKAVGIGVLSEITALICADSGNSALGKTLQMLSAAVIIWISLPLLNNILQIVENILEAI